VRGDLLGQVWPPKGIETFDPWHLPLLNTLILLTSGTTVTWAHHALLEDDREGLKWGLICTILLGACFTCVQGYEYYHAAFNYSGHIYGATFFMATGFHGAHVLIGTIFLIVCLIRATAGQFTPTQHLGFEFAAWYWHFVDVVWLFLFICIYVWARAPNTPPATDGDSFSAKGRLRPPFSFAANARNGFANPGRCTSQCGDRTSLSSRFSVHRSPGLPLPALWAGKLYAGFLTLRPRCEVCDLDFTFIDSGDGPAVFVILFAGFVVVGAALLVEVAYQPPFWVHGLFVGAADPDYDAWTVAANEGADGCPAISPQGRRRSARAA